MNPGIPNGKDILNSKVKHREHWRPFAPSVLEEYAGEWFDINKSKYMMFAAQVKEDKKEFIPSVTHKDGTSRIQTVSQKDNPLFYKLIQEFYKLTNIPMLLNTSLNKGGGPIVGHPSQAIDVYQNSELDVLCVGNELHIKENKEDNPQLKKIKEQIMQLSYKDKVWLFDKLLTSLEQEQQVKVSKYVMEQDKEALSKLSED